MRTVSVFVAAQAALRLRDRRSRLMPWPGLARGVLGFGVIRVVPAPLLVCAVSCPGSTRLVSGLACFASQPGSTGAVSWPGLIRPASRPRFIRFVSWSRLIRPASRPKFIRFVSWPGLARPPTTLHQTERQISLFRICCDDQTDFPSSGPPLDAGFTLYGCPHIFVRLAVNQAIELIAASERRPKAGLMCSHTASQIARHAEIQRSVWAIGDDVDPAGGHGRDITRGWLRRSLSRPPNCRRRGRQVVGGRAKPGHDTRQTEPDHDARQAELAHDARQTEPDPDARRTEPSHDTGRTELSHGTTWTKPGHRKKRIRNLDPSSVGTPRFWSGNEYADAA